MKKLVMFIVITLSLGLQVMEAQTAKLKVGTNSTNINSSAALEIQSTTQGFLPPRMGLSQITAIQSPAEGLTVFCNDCFPKTVLSFDGIDWLNAYGLPPLVIMPPAQATAVTATAGVGSASVAFTPAIYNNGGGVMSYTVISSPGNIQASGDYSPITISGLTAGIPYTFTVRATNISGLTSSSAMSNTVTPSASVPGSATSVVATAGTGTTASVSFTVPTNTGGAAITGYTVTSSPGGITATGTTSPITISGLSIGSTYSFTVVSTNSQGNSVASSTSNNISIAATAPNAPTIGTATISGTTASIVFTPPANTGGAAITSYTITPTPATTPATFSGTNTPITVTGLIAGTNYSFKVTATNSVGTSLSSAASNFVQAAGVPSAPTGIVATTVSGSSALVSFLASNANGSSVTGYTLTPSPATSPATFTSTTSPITVTGLTTGTNYTFSVTASNTLGTGGIGTVSFTPQNSVPSSPSGVVATAANGTASILFTPSTSNGGAAITGYTVTSTPGGITATSSTSPISVNGLINGTDYTFTVVATNGVGNSEASSPSNSVKPVIVPVPVLTATNLAASAAYSLRKLSSSYTGAAVRVRRSSDNTEQDISFTALGNLDTTALIAFVGSNNGFVSVWYDQSGNGKNSSQTIYTNQPRIVNAGVIDMINGKPSIYFNGNSNLSRIGMTISTDSNVAFTINTVFSTTQTGAGFWGQFDSTSNWTLNGLFNLYLASSTSGQAGSFFGSSQYGGGYATGNLVANTGVPVIGTITFPSSGNPSIFINASLNTNNQNPTRSNSLGGASSIERIGGNSVQFNNLIGYISELHLFQSQLTAARTSLELDQAAYYTITVSNVSATVSPPPPSNTSALAVNAAATINFTQSAGATNYTVTSSPGGITATGSNSPIQISGLSNGTAYTFTVVATNTYGTSSQSAATNSVTPSVGAAGQTVPSAPEIGTATAGNTSASVAFKAPANIGNSSITGYTVTSIPGGISATGASSPITVSGLTIGSSYNFSVLATNTVGNSIASATSNAIIPFGVPSKPVIGTITPFGLAASIPVKVINNGSAIISYIATVNPGNLIINSATASISVVLPRAGVYSVTVTATNAAGTSVSSAPETFSVAPVTSPQLSSYVSMADVNGNYFSGINGITPTTLISVGGTCPTSVIWQGVTYPTVNIGGQCWTARNSKALPTVSGLNYSYYLDATDETAAQEGLYYTWAAAMNGSNAERAQGVCPSGWHIPTGAEISYLYLLTGLTVNNINTNLGSSIVGATNWMNSLMKVGTLPGATNYTGFSNLNGGFRSDTNVFVGNFGLDTNSSISTLWTSTQTDTNNALRATFTDYSNNLTAGRSKLRSFSVRCLKD